MRVLICGSRQWTDRKTIEAFVGLLRPDTTIIEGESAGVDKLAAEAARWCNLNVEEYPADWKQYGLGAGAIRNQQMIDEGKPDVVVAFALTPITPGTADMIACARRVGTPVLLINSFGGSR